MSELLIPIAVSSQLDVSGEERIHIAHMVPSITNPAPTPAPDFEEIVLWGTGTSGGGMALDRMETFNSELAFADSVALVGWYSPEYEFSYPPSVDPEPIELSGYDFNSTEPTSMQDGTGSGAVYWGIQLDDCPMDVGEWLVVLDVDGTEYLAAVSVVQGV